jgi:hypothetical protein
MKPIIGFLIIAATMLALLEFYSILPPEKDEVRAATNDIEISIPEIGDQTAIGR